MTASLHRALKPPEVEVERASAESPPEFVLSRSRRFCSTCNIRKTYWVIAYGTRRNRRCWRCMTDRERAYFRSGY